MQTLKVSRVREWLDADSTGSYASLTENWENRRKYHALLVISRGAGFDRRVVLQNFLFNWRVPSPLTVTYDLDTTFRFENFKISLIMPRWKRTLLLKIVNEKELEIIPILNNRSIYDVNVKLDYTIVEKNSVVLNDMRVFFSGLNENTELKKESLQKIKFNYDIDQERGEEYYDEGYIICSLSMPAGENYLAIGLEEITDPRFSYETELKRRFEIYRRFGQYGISTEKYIVKDSGIIAGYHWFSVWGRDSMISLPGLTFAFGRYEEALRILNYFASNVSDGMFPNAMDERTGKWTYGSVDGGLWFINRLYLYWKYSQDEKGTRYLLDIATRILNRTIFGKETYIRDGVLYHPPHWTWMDCVGPHGAYVNRNAAVEVQALLYSACASLIEMSVEFDFAISDWIYDLPEKIQTGFRKYFIEKDIVKDSPDSVSLRPNALYTLYFHYSIVSPEEFKKTFEIIDKRLTTAFGLRSLDPSSENYKGRYLPYKDAAYHNGSVWPFLAGAAARAYLKIYGLSEKNKKYAYEKYLSGILDCLYVNGRCRGHVTEILDGDYPHEENGCIAQAWSLAEPLWAFYDLILSDPIVF